jgi:hypothetical protein
MDFFSGKNPDLIGPTMKTTLNDMINKPKIINSTISERVTNNLTNFYNDYIYEYKFVIILIILIIICLVYRYYYKNDDEKQKTTRKEGFRTQKKQDSNMLEEIKNYEYDLMNNENLPIAGDNPYDGHLYMNPLESINKQSNKTQVVYPPDKMPVNLPEGKLFTRNLYDNPVADEPLNFPDYDYDNVYKNDRGYYSGCYDTYKDAKDTTIENPLGWSNNFNTTMGNFVGPMTNSNLQSVKTFQTIVDNTEANLINGATGNAPRSTPTFEKPFEE